MFLNIILGGQTLLEEEVESNRYNKHNSVFTMRSKELLNLFYKTGHVMSYRDVLRLYTDLGENTLKTMDENSAIVPPNLVRGRFVHFSTENVDITRPL